MAEVAHILCIDDDAELLDTLDLLLRRNFPQHKVTPAHCGADALKEVMELHRQGREVALFLSDQLLGDTTGTELLARLKVYYPDAGRVILTGHAALESAVEGLRLHLDAYLEKPVGERELVKVLEPLLKRRDLQRHQSRLREIARETTARTSRLLSLTLEGIERPLLDLLSPMAEPEPAITLLRRGRENLLLLAELFRAQRAGEGDGDYFSPQELIDDAKRSLEAPGGLAALKSQSFKLIRRMDRVALFGHRLLQRALLERILHNACRFSPTGSTVVMVVRGPAFRIPSDRDVTPYPAEVGAWLRRGACVISVTNAGLLHQDDYLRILKVMNPAAGADTSAGLTLIIARELLTAMGGGLLFEGAPGKEGTTFHLALPAVTMG